LDFYFKGGSKARASPLDQDLDSYIAGGLADEKPVLLRLSDTSRDGYNRQAIERNTPGSHVHLPRKFMGDAGLQQWVTDEAPGHLESLGASAIECVDVSHNEITDAGAESLIDFFLERQRPMRRLKIFGNRLSEPFALCRLLEDPRCGICAPDGLAELHLSHNNIAPGMLWRLLESIAYTIEKFGRPRWPIWLRLERNAGLRDAGEIPRKLRVCFEAGPGARGCGIRHCRNDADVHLLLEGVKRDHY